MNLGLKQLIKAETQKKPQQECCGFILSKGKEFPELYPCENKEEDSAHYFSLGVDDYLKAEKEGDVLAYYHTHWDSDADFTEGDLQGVCATTLSAFLYSSKTDQLNYRCNPHRTFSELLNRRFVLDAQDCVTLVIDYVWVACGRVLRYFGHTLSDLSKGVVLDNGFLTRAGLTLIQGKPQPHDILLSRVHSSFPNHALIYLGDNRILHQLKDQVSRIDLYSDFWQTNTVACYRLKPL